LFTFASDDVIPGKQTREQVIGVLSSDVNKDLTLKAKDSAFKAKAKDRTFEGLNRELDI